MDTSLPAGPRRWHRGWGPLLGGPLAVVLVLGQFSYWRPARLPAVAAELGPGALTVLAVVFVLPIAAAVRRSTVLGPDTLTVRSLLSTHRIPLRDLVRISNRRGIGRGSMSLIVNVVFTTADGTRVITKSLGVSPWPAIQTIAAAARAAGRQPEVLLDRA